MKIAVRGGLCAGRFTCVNVNAKFCNLDNITVDTILFNTYPRKYVNCNHYSDKGKK
jgi:hypothetical protein